MVTRQGIAHYAVEELRARRSIRAWMQVGDERFNGAEIHRLYENGDSWLQKSSDG